MVVVMSVLGAVVMPHNLFFAFWRLCRAASGICRRTR